MPANLENSAVPQDWKRSVSIPIPKKGNAKNVQAYMNQKLPDVQAGFRKGRGTRDQIAKS